jgi:hypothetical protein
MDIEEIVPEIVNNNNNSNNNNHDIYNNMIIDDDDINKPDVSNSDEISETEREHLRLLKEMNERTDQGPDVCQFYLESAEWNLEKAIEIMNQYIVN